MDYSISTIDPKVLFKNTWDRNTVEYLDKFWRHKLYCEYPVYVYSAMWSDSRLWLLSNQLLDLTSPTIFQDLFYNST